jgi:glycosyltransferase involved in cell wall biosynthesis
MSAAATARLPAAPAPAARTVDIVIPARDEERLLPGCLDTLGTDPAVHEVVVVDDGSTDRTVAVATARGIRVITARPRPDRWAGKAWALHRGAAETAARWIVSIDADVRVPAAAVSALVGAAERDGVPAACLLGHLEGWLEFEAGLFVTRRACDVRAVNRGEARYLVGQCLAIRRDALAAAGGWVAVHDSAIEDVEMGERVAPHRIWNALGHMSVARRPGLRASWSKNMWRTHGGRRGVALETARLCALLALPWGAGPGGALAVYGSVVAGRLGARVAAGRPLLRSGAEALAWPYADGVLLSIFIQSVLRRRSDVRP